LVKSVQEKAYI